MNAAPTTTPPASQAVPPPAPADGSAAVAAAAHSVAVAAEPAAPFDPDSTTQFQARMPRAPVWFSSFLASSQREKRRVRDELVQIKGAWPLLMQQRRGTRWSPEDKQQLKAMVKSASAVSPYVLVWAVPGSVLLLPFLAWYLDRQRRKRKVLAKKGR